MFSADALAFSRYPSVSSVARPLVTPEAAERGDMVEQVVPQSDL